MIRRINREMLKEGFMLTSTIAYGKFKYEERIEFEGIEKNPVYGNAYISAFLDNEKGKPKIQPGQCRILKNNLPEELVNAIEQSKDEILSLVRTRKGDKNHYYFYWMTDNPQNIERFEKEYNDSYNLKYAGMLQALRRAVNGK